MERLFQATLSARWEGDASREAGDRLNVASSYDLWWTDNDPQQPALMPSVVRLSAECRLVAVLYDVRAADLGFSKQPDLGDRQHVVDAGLTILGSPSPLGPDALDGDTGALGQAKFGYLGLLAPLHRELGGRRQRSRGHGRHC
jgi:hypothetical protein